MLQHVCTTILLHPRININLIKIVIFPMFHVLKNLKLNRFNYISKVANFRVLHADWLLYMMSISFSACFYWESFLMCKISNVCRVYPVEPRFLTSALRLSSGMDSDLEMELITAFSTLFFWYKLRSTDTSFSSILLKFCISCSFSVGIM